MSNIESLPKSWAITEIEEVLSPDFNGKTIQQGWSPKCERYSSQKEDVWAVLKTTAIQEGAFWEYENKQLPDTLEAKPQIEVKKGDLLMTCAGPRYRCGVSCLVENTRPKLMMSGKMYRFRPYEGHFHAKFLLYYLHTHDAAISINEMKTGINDSGLNLTHDRFRNLIIPVAPYNEQKRIVDKIEELFTELDKGVESLKKAREQLKVYRQALLKQAFEGKLTEQWRKDNPDKVESADQFIERIKQERDARYQQQIASWKNAVEKWEKDKKEGKKPSKPRALKALRPFDHRNYEFLEKLPAGWAWENLGWMTMGVEYGTSAKSSESGTHPVLRMGNIQNAKFDWEDLVYTSDSVEISRYELRLNDVLFNRTNSPELVGKSAIYVEERPALFAGYLIRINQFDNLICGQYLNLFLNSFVAKNHGNLVKTDGVNQSNINGEKLSHYPFPYCSFAEQQKIVEILDEKLYLVERQLFDSQTNIRKAESLRQSILKMAFSGELVNQDEHDEPASNLLERIAKEKEEAETKVKRIKLDNNKTVSRKAS